MIHKISLFFGIQYQTVYIQADSEAVALGFASRLTNVKEAKLIGPAELDAVADYIVPNLTYSHKMQPIHDMEVKVISQLIDDMVAAGYSLDVFDGEETTLKASTDKAAILEALFSVDEECLYIRHSEANGGKRTAAVNLIHGNDGWDVIQDYSAKLEPLMTNTNALIEELAG